ncbi:MAG: ExbD/TolR family protein [Ramlibacter sp.]
MAFGRLERTPGHQPMSEINVTPLVDVMLVLVVIFIITAPLLASSIRLDLPKTEAATASEAAQFVTLSINPGGQVFLDERPVTLEQLAQGLQEAAARNPDTEVQLRADQTVPYGQVVVVMGVAQKAGLNRIGFVAEQPGAPAAAR